MNVLVTGGAGFIGSAFCRRAVGALGWNVAIVDKLTYAGHLSSLQPVADRRPFTFLQADICDRAVMDRAFAEYRPDAVVHFAAESHVDRSITASGDFIATNIAGTHILLEAATAFWRGLPKAERDRFRFLSISTDEVYGSTKDGAFSTEAAQLTPRSPYSASKAAADHLASAWWHTYGLPVVISRSANNFGPYQLPEKLIPLTILNALEGRALPIYGDGRHVRDWLHVEDHVDALLLLLSRGVAGEAYNVSARNERTNIDMVENLCRILDEQAPAGAPHKRLIRFVADRPGHDRRYAMDATKLKTATDWTPRQALEPALEATVAWYLATPEWWRPLRDAGHGRERLGLAANPHA